MVFGFPGSSGGKESACSVGGMGSIPGSGRCAGGGHGNPLQYSCLENSMDGGAWWATVHRVAKNLVQLSDFHFTSVVFTKDRLWGQISMRLTLSILMNKPGGFSSRRRSLTKAEFHLPGCHKTKANLCCNPSESWMPPSELQSNSCRCVQSVCFAELSWSNKE